MEQERRDYLPPEPPGPEPELGQAPPRPQAAQPQAPAPGDQATQQYPPPAVQGGWQQPAPPGWQQPPPPGWGYGPRPAEPDNGPAVAGFVLSIVSGGLLFLSAGISSLVSVGLAIVAIVYARKGKRKVESGETTRNAGLAQAGFVIGIVSLCLAVLASLFWIAILVAAISDPEFRDDLEREFDNSETIEAALRIAGAVARLMVG